MKNWRSMVHVKWECQYHIVFIPKYRMKKIYGRTRGRNIEKFLELCRYKGIEILEGHAMPDHVYTCITFPPKYSMLVTPGYINGKSAIKVHRELLWHKIHFVRINFAAPGYCLSTVGLNGSEILR
jgi:putative transposase